MGAIKAIDHVTYVGVLDKDLKVFDIIMETTKGTTYNAYLIRGQEKTVLVETVKDRFCEAFFDNIRQVCEPAEIDYIIASHTEPDHSGCLKKLLDEAPNATVLGSQTALTFLGEIVNGPFKSRAVTEKDVIDIGGMTLHFFMTPMLHWPDTIFTWVPEIGALFSCDCFGCHYADERIFNDLMDDIDFGDAYQYYFDNIMGPYKNPHMVTALNKVCDLDIRFVGNGHGPVLRCDIEKYLSLYRQWSTPVPHEKTVALCYVSAYGYTASLAARVEEGLREGGVKNIRVFDLVSAPMAEAQQAVEAADGILLGSPTLVGDALPPIYEVMLCLNPVIHRGRFGGAFGSYGWSGEATQNVIARMNQLHMNLPLPAMRVRLKPTDADLDAAHKYGVDFAQALLQG